MHEGIRFVTLLEDGSREIAVSEMTIGEFHLPELIQKIADLVRAAALLRGQNLGQGFCLKLKKRYYIMLVSRDDSGNLNKVPVPLHFTLIFS